MTTEKVSLSCTAGGGGHLYPLAGRRFDFGANWTRYLGLMNEERIHLAAQSLSGMLGIARLDGRSFLDVGSGSGLFSLAARRLGARVHSFDYDPQSVACARELKQRYFPDDAEWTIEEASVLDPGYLAKLGQFDIVYSWGVLHHTGAMWQALQEVAPVVANGGGLYLAIYNDQGWISRYWLLVKRAYSANRAMRWIMLAVHAPYLLLLRYLVRAARGHGNLERGMSLWHDMVDWIGGYPFEVAKPEAIFDFYRKRGFQLEAMKTCAGRSGCNEFLFSKLPGGLPSQPVG